MAFDFRQQKKKQNYLLWVVIVVIIFTVAILWFGVFQKEDEFVETTAGSVSLIKKMDVEFEVLENPLFEKLNPFEKISAFIGKIGRENPFLPY